VARRMVRGDISLPPWNNGKVMKPEVCVDPGHPGCRDFDKSNGSGSYCRDDVVWCHFSLPSGGRSCR
jgi:hypothetical protein